MDTALLVAHGDMADLFLYILEGIVNALHPAPGMPNASVTPSFRQISIMACDKFILSLPLLTVPINLTAAPLIQRYSSVLSSFHLLRTGEVFLHDLPYIPSGHSHI